MPQHFHARKRGDPIMMRHNKMVTPMVAEKIVSLQADTPQIGQGIHRGIALVGNSSQNHVIGGISNQKRNPRLPPPNMLKTAPTIRESIAPPAPIMNMGLGILGDIKVSKVSKKNRNNLVFRPKA